MSWRDMKEGQDSMIEDDMRKILNELSKWQDGKEIDMPKRDYTKGEQATLDESQRREAIQDIADALALDDARHEREIKDDLEYWRIATEKFEREE